MSFQDFLNAYIDLFPIENFLDVLADVSEMTGVSQQDWLRYVCEYLEDQVDLVEKAE